MEFRNAYYAAVTDLAAVFDVALDETNWHKAMIAQERAVTNERFWVK